MNKPALNSALQLTGLYAVAFAVAYLAIGKLTQWFGKWGMIVPAAIIIVLIFLVQYERAKLRDLE